MQTSRRKVTNIIFAGLGGHGVLKASDIAAEAAIRSGYDVKKSEIHGMSQRGGSVTSDVRFGDAVFSPMTPPGEADYLVVLSQDQIAPNLGQLRPGGILLHARMLEKIPFRDKRVVNVALLGLLSSHLPIPLAAWIEAIRGNLPTMYQAMNLEAFQKGRELTGQLETGGDR